jgi:hypothetical protein
MCFLSGNITQVVFLAWETQYHTSGFSWPGKHSGFPVVFLAWDISTQKRHECHFLVYHMTLNESILRHFELIVTNLIQKFKTQCSAVTSQMTLC